MNLYLLWQEVNNDYDTYDSCVVCAENMDEAIRIHPANNPREEPRDELWESLVNEWADLENIYCELIGKAAPGIPKGLVIASFNAG